MKNKYLKLVLESLEEIFFEPMDIAIDQFYGELSRRLEPYTKYVEFDPDHKVIPFKSSIGTICFILSAPKRGMLVNIDIGKPALGIIIDIK